MTRQEHLDWCKERALEYVNKGDLKNAYASMVSDMSKHSETSNHLAIGLGLVMQVSGSLDTPDKMREFILGFN